MQKYLPQNIFGKISYFISILKFAQILTYILGLLFLKTKSLKKKIKTVKFGKKKKMVKFLRVLNCAIVKIVAILWVMDLVVYLKLLNFVEIGI